MKRPVETPLGAIQQYPAVTVEIARRSHAQEQSLIRQAAVASP
jgi:hypothetical protein